MDMDQNGARIAQQGAGVILEQAAERERKHQERVDKTKQFTKEQVKGQVNKQLKPMRDTVLDKAISKMPTRLQDGFGKVFGASSKFLGKTADKLSNSKLGKLFSPMVDKLSSKIGKVADKFADAAKASATKAATKATATLAAPVTGGASIVAEQGISTAVEAGKAVKQTKNVADIAKATTPKKETVVDKAVGKEVDKLLGDKIPGMNGLKNLSGAGKDKKNNPDKDNNMAIFSGTKDMLDKSGVTKDFKFDLTK